MSNQDIKDFLKWCSENYKIELLNVKHGLLCAGKPDIDVLLSEWESVRYMHDTVSWLKESKEKPKIQCPHCYKIFKPAEDKEEDENITKWEYCRRAWEDYGWRLEGDVRYMTWMCPDCSLKMDGEESYAKSKKLSTSCMLLMYGH